MDEKLIIESLSPIERATIPSLGNNFVSLEHIVAETSQDETTAVRALNFLSNKGLVEIKSDVKKVVILGILGINYNKKELPERALLDKIVQKRTIPISNIPSVCGLNENESKIALGTLKRKSFIEIKDGKIHLIARAEDINNKFPEEIFLSKLPLDFDSLNVGDKEVYTNLASRRDIVEIQEQKNIYARLTEKGLKISKLDLKDNLIEQLTPKMILQGSWKGKKFRRYDITSPVPRIYGGKRHFVNQAKDYAKSIWLEMGFKEMTGNMAETSFWVFDSLFTAQDHPVREMQDTFYIKGIKGNISNKEKKEMYKVVGEIRKAHEGGIDNSKGWKCSWSEDESKKVLLRTHTTAISAKKLLEIGKTKELPAKYFALGKCFRNETVDWSHGFEFNQTEGIVVDENANFRQLLGYLKMFFNKMGYEKIRVRPGYFAYTEPSLEIDVFHPIHKKWLELGGAGMFRPEVTIPMFGRHIPVLAWGPGFDRIIMEFYKINDLRDMYKNDIKKLREMRFWREKNDN